MGQAMESSTQGPQVTSSPQMPIRPRFNEPLKVDDRAGATGQAPKTVSTVPGSKRLCPPLQRLSDGHNGCVHCSANADKRLQHLRHDHCCIGAGCKCQTGTAAHVVVYKQAKAHILTTARYKLAKTCCSSTGLPEAHANTYMHLRGCAQRIAKCASLTRNSIRDSCIASLSKVHRRVPALVAATCYNQGSTAHPDPARAEGIPASGRRLDAGCPPKPAHFRFLKRAQPASKNGTHAGNPRKMAEPE